MKLSELKEEVTIERTVKVESKTTVSIKGRRGCHTVLVCDDDTGRIFRQYWGPDGHLGAVED